MANDDVSGAEAPSLSRDVPVVEVQPVADASPVAGRAGPGMDYSGVLAALVPWLCFAAAAILAVGMMQEQSSRVQAQKSRLEAERTRQLAAWTAESKAVADKLTEAKASAEALRASQATATDDGVETLRAEVAERKQRLDSLGAELKDLQEQQPVAGDAKPAEAAKAAAPKPVSVADRVRELEGMRKKWGAAYAARMAKLQGELIGKLSAKDPVQLQKFYLQYIQSPFAPAALFAAAEGWFQQRDLVKARLNYSSLIAAYPDSEYCTDCNTRLVQVEARKQYKPLQSDAIRLYKPFELAR